MKLFSNGNCLTFINFYWFLLFEGCEHIQSRYNRTLGGLKLTVKKHHNDSKMPDSTPAPKNVLLTHVGVLCVNLPLYVSLVLGYGDVIDNGWAIMIDTIFIFMTFIVTLAYCREIMCSLDNYMGCKTIPRCCVCICFIPVIVNIILFALSFDEYNNNKSNDFITFLSAISILQYIFNYLYHLGTVVL